MVKFTEDMKNGGFERIPAGVTILKVTKMKPISNMGKIKEYKGEFEDCKGRKVWNNYNMNPKNQWYLNSMRAFYSLLKTGCGLIETADGEIEPEDAVDKYFVAKIKHTEKGSNTYVNLGYVIAHAESFEDDISEYIERENARDAKKNDTVEEVAEDVSSDDDEDDPYA